MDKKPVNAQPEEFNLPKLEEKILAVWKSKRIFEKSLEKRKTKDKKKTFVFYEGPPTANGKPGIHHVLARSFKDVILRYKTMAGFYVPRKGGWDTHGLPVEIEVEKQLGLKSKKDIEQFGIAEFNRTCKESVWKYKEEWERLTERMGFWLDLKNPYITYTAEYMETLWWIISEMWKKKLLYKGHRVVPWCMRCGTALSSHELAQGYKETTDQSVYIKFRLKPGQKIKNLQVEDSTYILSWTTTPWTLPGNVALAVGGDIDYVGFKATSSSTEEIKKGDVLLLANNPDIVKKVFGDSLMLGPRGSVVNFFGKGEVGLEKMGVWSGNDLAGLEYEPLFDIPSLKNEHSHKVYTAGFVTTTDGTGVVHTAVMYGEDDYKLGVKVGLPQRHTVTEEGKFTAEVPANLAGMPVKPKDLVELKKTEDKILNHLHSAFHLLRTEPYTHEYPYCWRCSTPVIYYARDSWFVAMTKVKKTLISENKKINWVPSYMKEGRFGEWLREVKDWNFSRERYWGTPLPVWECKECLVSKDAAKRNGATEVIGSIEALRARVGHSKNKYWIMRHGEAESNISDTLDSGQKDFHLTLRGRTQVESQAKRSLKKGIDLIIASDIERTKETAELMSKKLGVETVVFDPRIREINLGSLTGCHDERYRALFPTYEARFETRPDGGGESLRDLRGRIAKFFEDTEKKYEGKNILIVSHEYSIWMAFHVGTGWNEAEAIREKEKRKGDFVHFADIHPLHYKKVPRNDSGEIDLHRPYVDMATFPCKSCGGEMKRTKEVVDVWFDSGAMPFAQDHWPFETGQGLPAAYPADYICEAIDQTRGWFYTLLAIGTALGKGTPYKNVISLGHINDKFGQKMSKSKGNIVDPWLVAEKYGMDAIRWYFFTATPPGEPKNFDEIEIQKTFRKFHLILWNSVKFFETYRAKSKVKNQKPKVRSPLDEWITARLDQTISRTTENLEKYDIREAALAIENFVDDLSRWYIRRSRRRFQPARQGGSSGEKSQSKADHYSASITLGYVLREIGKLIAPFTPLFAEIVSEHLSGSDSVHLENWSKADSKLGTPKSKLLLDQMAEIRRLATLGLAARATAGIRVRQPLQKLKIKNEKLKISRELLGILAEEVNVKEVVVDVKLSGDIELDTAITVELKEEGIMRDLTRLVQDLRQGAKLLPKDKIALFLELPMEVTSAIQNREKMFSAEVGAKRIEYKKSTKFDAEIYSKFGDADIWIGLKKS